MDKIKILEELLNLINSAETKNEEKFSFGLLYNYVIEDGLYVLNIEVRQEINDDRSTKGAGDHGKFKEAGIVHKIYFNTVYELIKYLLWRKYRIELSDIFSFEKVMLESINLNFYEEKNLNSALKEVFIAIRNNNEMEETSIGLQEEAEEKEDEIDSIFREIYEHQITDIILDKPLYSDDIYCNNCGYVWDNITDFKILGFRIEYIKERKVPFYSLDIKFQIESYLEDSNIMNYYDIEIPRFLIFPAEIENEDSRMILKNNLLLIYNMTDDIIYSMILKEFINFREYPVTISNMTDGMKLDDFKEEVLSELAKHLAGQFYVGSRNIYMEHDVMNLCNEFMKRSFFEFKKYLFSEFVISSTGIRINDLNTVNSFYTMIENISLRFEKEKENEEDEN